MPAQRPHPKLCAVAALWWVLSACASAVANPPPAKPPDPSPTRPASAAMTQLAAGVRTQLAQANSQMATGVAATLAARPTATPTEAPTRTPRPTATPSPSPTRTPRPTATATFAPGDVMFQADFDDLTDWMDYGWSMDTGADTANYTFESRAGSLAVEVSEKDTVVYGIYAKNLPFSDVQIDVDTETSGPDLNNIALVCRANDDGWYHLSIASSGLWSIYRYEDKTGYHLLGSGGSTAIHMVQRTNHLTAMCQGDTLTLYVNDVKVGSAKDQKYSEGRVGVAVATLDAGGTGIQFTNLKVRRPDPDNPPGGAVAPTLPPRAAGQAAAASDSGSVYPTPPLPGNTKATLQLQSDTLRIMMVMVLVNAPQNCSVFQVINTEFIGEVQPVQRDAQGQALTGEWIERWTFAHCGTQMAYRIDYRADGTGGVHIDVRAW